MTWNTPISIFSILLVVLSGACVGGGADTLTVRHSVKSSATDSPLPPWCTKQYVLGQFDPARHPDFAILPLGIGEHSHMYLRREATEALIEMVEAARRDGIHLLVRSATRNFARQKEIWESKWRGDRLLEGREFAPRVYPQRYARAKAILRWSSMPGSSRHHWGTDIDFNSFDNAYFDRGHGRRLYDWMKEYACGFGFCQPYTPRDSTRPFGYNEERWHWSYRPLASICLRAYRDSVGIGDIKGFLGSEMADRVHIIEHYVLGIHPDCL